MFGYDNFEGNTLFEKRKEYRRVYQFNKIDYLIVLTELRNKANRHTSFSITIE